MKYLSQFLIIIAFSFLAELLNWLLPFTIPASIYGIILLFIALELKIVKVKDVREVSNFLIYIMPLMFLPPAVGLLDAWSSIKESWIYLVIISVVSTFAVMAVTGWVSQWIIGRKKN